MKHVLFLLLLAPAALPAQDRIGTRLNWGNVQVLVYPSRALGMQLQLSTTARVSPQLAHGMSGGFEPESVFTWINAAARILDPGAAPSGPDVMLLSPVLRSACGDSLRLMRRSAGNAWDRRIALLLDEAGPRGEHFDVLTGRPEIEALFAGLQREAGLSGYSADSVAIADVAFDRADSLRPEDIPRVVRQGSMRYPDMSKAGRIVVTFVVTAEGRADTASVRTIYADHAVFEVWAKELLAGTRFTPGRLRGEPVPVLVQQAISYVP